MNEPSGKVWLFVMAGGSGTRFWPRSRANRPKQLLNIIGDEALLTVTLRRFSGLVDEKNSVVVTTEFLAKPTKNVLPQFQGTILVEPEARNTAPCLVMAMEWLRQRDPKAVAIVVPADHWVSDTTSFQEVIRTAIQHAQQSRSGLLTIGITPTRAETGFGYIRSGDPLRADESILAVERFVEKPKQDVAEAMIQDPSYLWNSGMFVWSVTEFFRTLAEAAPEFIQVFAPYREALNTPGADSEQALRAAYGQAPVISIDYALLEKSKEVAVLPGSFDWNDLGSFPSLCDLYPLVEGGSGRAKRVMAIDSIANLVDAPEKVVALLGVTNMMIVDVGDVLLVAARERSQDVKKFVERLKQSGDPDHLL